MSDGRLALLVGGGPAPGINGVISSVTIEAINHGMEVIGVRDGYKWLVRGSTDYVRRLSIADVSPLNLKGGSVLGTSRTNPAANEEDMARVLEAFRKLGVTDLVSIGGDDTAYSASQVYQRAGGTIRVAHVPKTIDNDLPLPGSTPTFGFETARHLGVGIVRNLAEDAKTTSRWYLIVSMGRAAGHLALGIGKASAATITIIPEEFRGREVTLDLVCDIIIGGMIKRRSHGKEYGIAVLAEGLLESIGDQRLRQVYTEEELRRYGRLERDPHGHLRLGEIEFGRMVKDRLTCRLGELGWKAALIDKDLGYELRCADPIPFDAEYTRDLGYGAVDYLRRLMEEGGKEVGAMITVQEEQLVPLPCGSFTDPATGRPAVRDVNVRSGSYRVATEYMIRLEQEDLDDPARLGPIAGAAGMTPDAFRERFGYLVQARAEVTG
jgi:6-phosphofructokinase